MHRYCELNKLDVFQYLPIQFTIDFSSMNFTHEIDKFCGYFNMIQKYNRKHTSADAATIELNKEVEKKFNDKRQARKYNLPTDFQQGQNIWLIKPNDCNRGRGVSVFNSLSSLRSLLKEFTKASGGEISYFANQAIGAITQNEKHQKGDKIETAVTVRTDRTENQGSSQNLNLTANVRSEVFVIQKYIEKPLLVDERKFDIRLWVLVAQDQRCYLFKEGYIRTSSYKFTLSQESIDQPMIHLTNNAVQQFDDNYGKLEEGNQLSFLQASELINEQEGRTVDFHEIVSKQIAPVIEMTLASAESKLNSKQRKNCFEIFGYDFMVDDSLQPWLIEVNTNPCLEETSQLLKQYLPRMLDDAFKLTIDVFFPQRSES